jgi:hypothetical protein
MNSLQLIQGVCRKWLTVPDQTALDLSAVQDLLDGINLVQAEVWRSLPVHYKRQSMSLDFYAPAAGTVAVTGYGSRSISGVTFPTIMDVLTFLGEPLTYEGEPLLFNGSAVTENPRPNCSIFLNGDPNLNQFTGSALVHPYLGTSASGATTTALDFSSTSVDWSSTSVDFSTTTVDGSSEGVVDATLYHDAKLTSAIIERVVSPVVDRITGNPYFFVERHPSGCVSCCRTWSMRRIMHVGVMRTLFELSPGHDSVVVLSFDALVTPSSLNLGSSQRPVDLPYDAEVAGLITAMAGENLRQHPSFNRELFTAADVQEIANVARKQLSTIPGQLTCGPVSIGTPRGF